MQKLSDVAHGWVADKSKARQFTSVEAVAEYAVQFKNYSNGWRAIELTYRRENV
jgi:hypothetical protein